MPDPVFELDLIWVVVSLAAFVGFLAIIIATSMFIWRRVHSGPPASDPAFDALRTRLAKGEIDDAEFQRLRSVLQSH